MEEVSAHNCSDCGTELNKNREDDKFICSECEAEFEMIKEENAHILGHKLN